MQKRKPDNRGSKGAAGLHERRIQGNASKTVEPVSFAAASKTRPDLSTSPQHSDDELLSGTRYFGYVLRRSLVELAQKISTYLNGTASGLTDAGAAEVVQSLIRIGVFNVCGAPVVEVPSQLDFGNGQRPQWARSVDVAAMELWRVFEQMPEVHAIICRFKERRWVIPRRDCRALARQHCTWARRSQFLRIARLVQAGLLRNDAELRTSREAWCSILGVHVRKPVAEPNQAAMSSLTFDQRASSDDVLQRISIDGNVYEYSNERCFKVVEKLIKAKGGPVYSQDFADIPGFKGARVDVVLRAIRKLTPEVGAMIESQSGRSGYRRFVLPSLPQK
jgi:hypothetical protein